jgi:hypothetical protein
MYSAANSTTCVDGVLLVTKHTFIEFRWPEVDNAAQLQRSKSEPSLVQDVCSDPTTRAKGLLQLTEAATPTTCASINGDDDSDTQSFDEEVLDDQIITNVRFNVQSHLNRSKWSDISDCDSTSVVSESLESADADEPSEQSQSSGGPKKNTDECKSGRSLSGRSRQRERRRRWMATAGPTANDAGVARADDMGVSAGSSDSPSSSSSFSDSCPEWMMLPGWVWVSTAPAPQQSYPQMGLEMEAQRAQLGTAALRAQVQLEVAESCMKQKPVASDVADEPTTLMLRNIPLDLTRDMFLKMIDDEGFAGKYDLIYLPTDFKTSANLGYGFVNLTANSHAVQMQESFEGFCRWGTRSAKKCEAQWSSTQGLVEYIRRYRNSPVMHESVPDEVKPMLFKHGVRVAFPAPTRKLKAPQSQ